MRPCTLIGVAFVVGLSLSGGLAAQRPDPAAAARLRVAIDKEVVDGDLKGAIEEYKAIVTKYGKTDRPVAAQALLQMATSYEKLGSAEAQEIYARIVSEYADQPTAVSRARANMRSTGGGGPQILGPQVVRRLGADATEISLSPDGQTLAMYGLSLLDLATGKTSRLNPNPGMTPEELKRTGRIEDAEWPVLTRDSKQVAYEWYVFDGTTWTSQLRVMPTEPGARPRTLVNNPEFTYFIPAGWANDGTSVLTVVDKKDTTRALAWVSTTDGTVRVVQSLGWELYGRPSLSPDGRYIAYAALTTAPDRRIGQEGARLLERHIYVLASDGSSRSELTLTTGVVDQSPVWTPDGAAVVFSSNRSGTFGLWSVPVKDGKTAGPVSLVRSNTGEVQPLGITRTGTLYYANYVNERTVSVVSVTRGGATTARVTSVLTGSSVSWSPDSKTVAVGRPIGDGGSAPRLVLHSVETGEERSYSHDRLLLRVPARWFPDSKHLLVAVDDGTKDVGVGHSALFSLDLQSGVWAPVLPADRQRGPVYLGPDNKTLYYLRETEPATPYVIVKVDLATGSKTQVFDFAKLPKGDHYAGNLSPDGQMWAVRGLIGADTYVHVIALNAGGYRELYHAPDGPVVSGLQWSHDSRTIYWAEESVAKEGAPRRLRIMQIAASGGPVEFSGIELDGENNGYPYVSPDGSRVAVTTYRQGGDIWALDLSSLIQKPQ